jgi:hypothetical protein
MVAPTPSKWMVSTVALASLFASACTGSIGEGAQGGSRETPGDQGPGATGGADPQGKETPFVCVDGAARAPTLSYTLTKDQYRNVIADLFGPKILDAIQDPLSALPADLFDKVTNTRSTGISAAKIEAYFDLAKSIASLVTSDTAGVTAVFGSCANAATPAPSCIDAYLDDFAPRLLRRPLTSDEVTYAKQVASGSGGYLSKMGTLLTVHLMSPAFLWRLEINGSPAGGGEAMKLTSYEVASRISFETVDSTPDATLTAAAAAGQLATKEQVRNHVQRLLHTPNGRAKVRNSILRWSLQDTVTDSSIDRLPAALTQGLSLSGLAQAMLDESRAYVDHQVYDQASSFNTILTSKESLASHPGLAAIYGHAPGSATAPAAFAGRRQGLLMRAPFLASSDPRTPLIHRGVNFAKLILCRDIPPPDPETLVKARTTPVFTPAEALTHTNRETIARQTAAPGCQACHGIINNMGYAFEVFDSVGRIRSQEAIFDPDGSFVRDLPVDASISLPLPDGSTQAIQDAYDLVTYVSTSAEGSACLVKNAHRFVFERLETDEDACQLQAVSRIMADPHQSMLDALTELIANDRIFDKQNQ